VSKVRVRLTCGDHVIELAPGDSCHFDGRVPHAIENRGSSSARVLIAMTPAAYEPMFRVQKTTVTPVTEVRQLTS
jgi:quercetin dioxygenase-like cupin family protein